MKEIKTLIQEAEIYQSQGLLQDALRQYISASKILLKKEQSEKKNMLMRSITKKIHQLEQSLYNNQQDLKTPKLSKKSQDLVKNLSSYSKKLGKDEALLEGAMSLAKLGQYKSAITEFNKLLTNKKLCVHAAKNIIRNFIALSKPEMAVKHYKRWIEKKRFQNRQFENIRLFLESNLKNKGFEKLLSSHNDTIPEKPPTSNNQPIDDEPEEPLDIISIGIILENRSKEETLELDVNFQSGNNINVILTSNDHKLVEHYSVGYKIPQIRFFLVNALFIGQGIVSSFSKITLGPKIDNYSLDFEIID